jgi:hypothetical protein
MYKFKITNKKGVDKMAKGVVRTLQTLKEYLVKYEEMQEDLILCYRPTIDKGWNDRCLYGDDKYDEYKAYNHRSILHNEIIIEFDDDDIELNKKCMKKVIAELTKDNICYSLWTSGNKSEHCHFFIDSKQCKNIALLKKVVMRYYTTGLAIQPDLRLASSHLIRAEYGVNEKSGVNKTKIQEIIGYPRVNTLRQEIWDKYKKEEETSIKRRISFVLTDLATHPIVRYLLDSANFQSIVGDGHERTLFMLIHVLKPKYKTKEELTKILLEWYAYSGGFKLKPFEIKSKVNYHWNRNYNITINFLYDLCAELGIEPPAEMNEVKENKVVEKNGEIRTNG